jgi:hypothetical protein
MFWTWEVPDYGGDYDWPAGVKFTDEQQDEIDRNWDDVKHLF